MFKVFGDADEREPAAGAAKRGSQPGRCMRLGPSRRLVARSLCASQSQERVDIAGLCRAAVETAKPRAAEKAQKLDVEISASAGHVFGDARRLRESVEHVLQNAIAYTDAKGRISLSADGDKKQAVIRIRDNGSGIETEDLPRVFNRFDRVTEAGVRGEAALGLGLPLTQQFIEAHGGTVDLESKKGKGTTVTLAIPRGTR